MPIITNSLPKKAIDYSFKNTVTLLKRAMPRAERLPRTGEALVSLKKAQKKYNEAQKAAGKKTGIQAQDWFRPHSAEKIPKGVQEAAET